MTLKELLDSTDFKDIATALVQSYPQITGKLAHFKQAYDILRNLEPEGSGKLEIVRVYNEFTQTYYPLISRWFELDEWKYELACEIIVDDNLTLTGAEIAAHCLWELTYLGFDQSTPEKHTAAMLSIIGEQETNISGPYDAAVEKLKRKLETPYKPQKFKTYKSIDEYEKDRSKRNRRIEKRITKFERLAKVEDARIEKRKRKAKIDDAINRLIADTNSFKKEELKYLFNTERIYENNYQSSAYDVTKRIDYMIDLFSNYVNEDFSKYTHFLLMFRTSSKYSLTQAETEALQNFFIEYLPKSANVRFGYGSDENLGVEVELMVLGSR